MNIFYTLLQKNIHVQNPIIPDSEKLCSYNYWKSVNTILINNTNFDLYYKIFLYTHNCYEKLFHRLNPQKEITIEKCINVKFTELGQFYKNVFLTKESIQNVLNIFSLSQKHYHAFAKFAKLVVSP